LAAGYEAEFDAVDEPAWCQLVQCFTDGNIYQTWACAAQIGGRCSLRSLVLKRDGNVVAIAIAKVRKIPVFGLGVASVFWGPLWRRKDTEVDAGIFRQAVRALRNEMVRGQGLTLRLFPLVIEDDTLELKTILADEGFSLAASQSGKQTILMDLRPPLSELRESFSPNWKRNLRKAEKGNLEYIEGNSLELFDDFLGMYKEMKSRKGFTDAIDLPPYKDVQAQLPEPLKMRILLCKSEDGLCAGNIYSQMGDSALCLFGATSNLGMKNSGSYLLWWKMLQTLKQEGVEKYDLNGINPEVNPGTYRFKRDFAGKHGRHVRYVGRYDANAGLLSVALLATIEVLRSGYQKLRQRIA
jgi:CelD/BcsL family acetyltransferase involved in cellulose biosynthesis